MSKIVLHTTTLQAVKKTDVQPIKRDLSFENLEKGHNPKKRNKTKSKQKNNIKTCLKKKKHKAHWLRTPQRRPTRHPTPTHLVCSFERPKSVSRMWPSSVDWSSPATVGVFFQIENDSLAVGRFGMHYLKVNQRRSGFWLGKEKSFWL